MESVLDDLLEDGVGFGVGVSQLYQGVRMYVANFSVVHTKLAYS